MVRRVDRAERRRAELYRQKAEEVRALAAQMRYVQTRAAMLQLAHDYEVMAANTGRLRDYGTVPLARSHGKK